MLLRHSAVKQVEQLPHDDHADCIGEIIVVGQHQTDDPATEIEGGKNVCIDIVRDELEDDGGGRQDDAGRKYFIADVVDVREVS